MSRTARSAIGGAIMSQDFEIPKSQKDRGSSATRQFLWEKTINLEPVSPTQNGLKYHFSNLVGANVTVSKHK